MVVDQDGKRILARAGHGGRSHGIGAAASRLHAQTVVVWDRNFPAPSPWTAGSTSFVSTAVYLCDLSTRQPVIVIESAPSRGSAQREHP